MGKPEWYGVEFDIDEDTTSTTVHESTFWEERKKNFNNSNMGQRVSNFQANMEDSDSAIVRNAYGFFWKIKEGLRISGEESQVVEVITRIDPTFSLTSFCEMCRKDFIPNILEAACQGDEEILDDWCLEKAKAMLLANKQMAVKEGLSYQRHVYSLQNVDVMDCSIDDEMDTPTIMVSASTQEMIALINKEGEVVDGSTTKPMINSTIFCFTRDMHEVDNKAAWKLLEIQSSAQKMSF